MVNDAEEGKVHQLCLTIHTLLTNDIRYRDDFNLLVNRIHNDELTLLGINPRKLSVYDFFKMRMNKQVSNEHLIHTIASRVQNSFPETRPSGINTAEMPSVNP